MFLPLLTPRQMNMWDRTTMDEYGIPGLVLMENASRAAFDVLQSLYGDLDGARCLLVAGPGNNGGDAFAVGRHLHDAGAKVLVVHTTPKKNYKKEAGQHLRMAVGIGTPLAFAADAHSVAKLTADKLGTPDIVVDGFLGTGLSGGLRPKALEIVRTMNEIAVNALAFAIDIPSGLNGQTGAPSPEAFLADATATFEAAKTGLVQPGSDTYVGDLHICPIGIPELVRKSLPLTHRLATDALLEMRPHATQNAHKGTFGHVLVIGGSPGLTGAPFLAALGALRTGAGLVSVASPEALGKEIKHNSPEVMLVPLPGEEWQAAHAPYIGERLEKYDAIVLGPGLGRSKESGAFLKAFLKIKRPPTIIDADALYFLAFPDSPPPARHDVLTPHPLEAARLLGLQNASKVQQERMNALSSLVLRYKCTCLLKGAGSLVGTPAEPMTIFPFSQPCLAVGGSGDVLSGVIGALCATGMQSHQAAMVGTYLHGCAGERLERMFPFRGNLAWEIADALPVVGTTPTCRSDTIEESTPC
ncbi:MAG: NAD(P)H-hydrate dehydratase [Desulfovibrio sp.]|uniref:NAD(P)H-hydrate dehydratase n=1 Tax=Desulfovibrio sp. 7SRBS1 TaxID=3378064 RepID=UPI003B3FF775